jgi:hypothetical protein
MAFRAPVRETCMNCQKVVYPTEKMSIDGKVLHKTCFTCKHCSRQLTMSGFAAVSLLSSPFRIVNKIRDGCYSLMFFFFLNRLMVSFIASLIILNYSQRAEDVMMPPLERMEVKNPINLLLQLCLKSPRMFLLSSLSLRKLMLQAQIYLK